MKTNCNTLLSLVTFFTITIGGTAQNLASPLQLTDFTAECNNGPALIKWTAQVETDVDYFTLERTTDGTN